MAGECIIRFSNAECEDIFGEECTPEFCASRNLGHIGIDAVHDYAGCTAPFCTADESAADANCLRVGPLSTEHQTCIGSFLPFHSGMHDLQQDGVSSYTWVDVHTPEQSVLYWVDAMFNFVYIVELLVKLVALSLAGYFDSRWNRLDFLIVITSAIGMLFSESEVKVFK